MVNRSLRIVFMGTPEFAVPSLQFLLEAGYPVVGVVTATDKLGGRGNKETLISAVKSFAQAHHLNILQPQNLKSKEFINQLRELKADLQVIVAFRMLPEIVWNMPRFGTMNLHASLLPQYRGAAPINWAIINGESKTGLTTFMLQHEIDTGAIISQREVPILPEDSAGTLHDRLMQLGAGLVLGSVDAITAGKLETHKQEERLASHAPKIYREDAHLYWNQSVHKIINLVRGMSPYPGAWTTIEGKEVKILKAKKHSDKSDEPVGTITQVADQIIIQAADGEIEILEIQMAGKKKMLVQEFVKGNSLKGRLAT